MALTSMKYMEYTTATEYLKTLSDADIRAAGDSIADSIAEQALSSLADDEPLLCEYASDLLVFLTAEVERRKADAAKAKIVPVRPFTDAEIQDMRSGLVKLPTSDLLYKGNCFAQMLEEIAAEGERRMKAAKDLAEV
jgi:hypothetical protein